MAGAKTFLYMVMMTVLLVLVGGAIDISMGGGGSFMVIFFVIAVGMNFFTYWFADTIVLKMHKARVVTPEEAPQLHRMVDRLIERAGLPKPKVCVIASDLPNAFATGRNRSHSAVAVTEGLIRNLSEDELEGVIAHELTHIKNYDMLLNTVIASSAGLISIIANMAMWRMIFGGHRRGGGGMAIVGLLFTVVLAPMLAGMIRSLISHQREFAADAGGAKMSGKPLALASALRNIERQSQRLDPRHMGTEATAHMYFINHFSLGRNRGRRRRGSSTHPATEERIERLLAIHERGVARA